MFLIISSKAAGSCILSCSNYWSCCICSIVNPPRPSMSSPWPIPPKPPIIPPIPPISALSFLIRGVITCCSSCISFIRWCCSFTSLNNKYFRLPALLLSLFQGDPQKLHQRSLLRAKGAIHFFFVLANSWLPIRFYPKLLILRLSNILFEAEWHI